MSSRQFQWVLYPVEVVVLGFSCVTLILYWWFQIPLRTPGLLYIEKLSGGGMWYGTGLLLCLLFIRLRDLRLGRESGNYPPWSNSISHYAKAYLAPNSVLRDLRLVHALALMFVIYIHLKHLIPLVNPSLYDGVFAAADRAVCAGSYCGELMLSLFGGNASEMMSEAYVAFFPYMGFLLMTMILQRDADLSIRFCLAFSLLWLLGILLVYSLPTLGPCYWSWEAFSSMAASETSELRVELLEMSSFVLSNPKSPNGAYMIAGFPSLHLAAPTLGTVYLWSINRVLGVLSLLFFLATMCSTLYFGWHYLLDNIGAVILALGICFVVEGRQD